MAAEPVPVLLPGVTRDGEAEDWDSFSNELVTGRTNRGSNLREVVRESRPRWT